jgi:rSAM/selenodomain-associated transferase 1
VTRPAALVLAKAARPGFCKTRLEPLLGPDGCARLQAALTRRAVAWADSVGDPFVAFTPADARGEAAALCPPSTELLPQVSGSLGDRLQAAVRSVLGVHPGPVLVVGVDTPWLATAHAVAALDDLADGVDVTLGPASDGGYYLVGLREPHDAVFDLPPDAWGGPHVMFLTMEASVRAGLSIGMLRSERDLDEEADALALLADPLAPPDIVAILRGARSSPPSAHPP